MIGDAEIDEGSIWEALFIKDKNIKNLVLVIDKNNVSASKKIFKKANLNPKILKNLGLKYFNIDGHNIKKIFNTLKKVNSINSSSLIIINTIKGRVFLKLKIMLNLAIKYQVTKFLKIYLMKINKKDIRDIFFENIRKIFLKRDDFYILTNDADVFALEKIKKHKRFIDAGVCEQNLINIASGLARRKKKGFGVWIL